MRPNWTNIIAASLLAMVVTPAFAGTGGGRITFQGAVVTPTCTVDTTRAAPAAQRRTTQQRGCANATRTGLAAGAVAVRTVQLDHRQVTRLLRHFTANALAAVDGQTRAVLVQYDYR